MLEMTVNVTCTTVLYFSFLRGRYKPPFSDVLMLTLKDVSAMLVHINLKNSLYFKSLNYYNQRGYFLPFLIFELNYTELFILCDLLD